MEDRKRLLLKGKKESAKAGVHQGGALPFGYAKEYAPAERRLILRIEPMEADIINRIFSNYLRFKSIGKVAEDLNASGKLTRNGKKWSKPGIGFILSNEIYLGKVKYGEIKAKGLHDPIVSPIVFNMVQALKRGNIRNPRSQPH